MVFFNIEMNLQELFEHSFKNVCNGRTWSKNNTVPVRETNMCSSSSALEGTAYTPAVEGSNPRYVDFYCGQ